MIKREPADTAGTVRRDEQGHFKESVDVDRSLARRPPEGQT